ncbi:hypothetical protein GCM10027566_31060 [Arachidicoccus ginsenosidivorans]
MMKRLNKPAGKVASRKSSDGKNASDLGSKKGQRPLERKEPRQKIDTPADTGAWQDKGDPIYAAVAAKRPGL